MYNKNIDEKIDKLIDALDHFINTNKGSARLNLREALQKLIREIYDAKTNV